MCQYGVQYGTALYGYGMERVDHTYGKIRYGYGTVQKARNYNTV